MWSNFKEDCVKSNIIHKISSIIIYLLVVILVGIISFSLYISYEKKTPKIPPHNSISVSPFTGERIQLVQASTSFNYVKYKDNNLSDLYNIDCADIVYEYYNNKLNIKEYSAIFYDHEIKLHNSIESITPNYLSSNSVFNFMDILDVKKYKFSLPGDVIFLRYNNSLFSKFVYKDGQYVHYSSSINDRASISNKELTYSNVVIQFIDKNTVNPLKDIPFSIQGIGNGILFTAGGHKEIYWKNSKIFLKDCNEPFTLQRGQTFWIITDKNTNITLDNNK